MGQSYSQQVNAGKRPLRDSDADDKKPGRIPGKPDKDADDKKGKKR